MGESVASGVGAAGAEVTSSTAAGATGAAAGCALGFGGGLGDDRSSAVGSMLRPSMATATSSRPPRGGPRPPR